jgi:hypothetical protein
MKKRIILACIGMMVATPLLASNRPGAFTLTLADGYYMFAHKRHLDPSNIPNLAVAYNFNEKWALEAGVGALNTSQTQRGLQGVHGFLYTLDGIYRFTPRCRFEPYVSAGLGVLSLYPNGLDPEQQTNLNAGIGTQWFADRSVALRAELRDVYTMAGGKNDVMANFGVSFLFGGQ